MHANFTLCVFSTDSGWDNPFRPDGDLSREADEIVELIKGGKPITPTPGSVAPPLPSVDAHDAPTVATAASAVQQQSPPPAATKQQQQQQQPQANNKAAGANGNALESKAAPATTGPVEVQRGTVVQPIDASQVEHVVLKKKPKCKCCVIQ